MATWRQMKWCSAKLIQKRRTADSSILLSIVPARLRLRKQEVDGMLAMDFIVPANEVSLLYCLCPQEGRKSWYLRRLPQVERSDDQGLGPDTTSGIISRFPSQWNNILDIVL